MIFPLPIRLLLWPLSVLYGWIARLRVLLYDKEILRRKRLIAPVISVGNLTVGGTGKTPMVLYLAEKFLGEGKRVGILTRGYRGASGTSDEVELLKRRLGNRVAFGVGPDRFREGRKLEANGGVDLFLLDDGFQHLQVERDVDILLLDGSKKMGDQWLLPAGSLREPLAAGTRADIIVVTRRKEREAIEAAFSCDHPIFYAQTRLLGMRKLGDSGPLLFANELDPGSFFAFCGIGNPEAFFNDLEFWRVPLAGRRAFRDHHRYSQTDVEQLEQRARVAGAKALITTEKDEENLRDRRFAKLPIYVAVIDFVLSSENEFDAVLNQVLAARRKPA